MHIDRLTSDYYLVTFFLILLSTKYLNFIEMKVLSAATTKLCTSSNPLKGRGLN